MSGCRSGRFIVIPECNAEDELEERVEELEKCCKEVQSRIPPEVSDVDDGKVLMVVGGVWTAQTLPDGTNIQY